MSLLVNVSLAIGSVFIISLLLFGIWAYFLPYSMRPLFRMILWFHYSVRYTGIENIPKTGPVLFAGNHVTWIDGFVIASVSPRPITVLVNKDYCDNPGQRWLARRMNVIPIPTAGPKAQRLALDKMRSALDDGRTVGLFPEAQLTRSGVMNPFQRGMELILKDKPEVVVIPVGLAGLWGSIFSFSGGRFFKKRPQTLRRKVGISFGKPLPSTIKAIDLRQNILLEVVKATELIDNKPLVTDIIDFELGHWRHPQLGLLTASAPDFVQVSRRIHQTANKPGSVGQVLAGVAIRAVDDSGRDVGYNLMGRLQARILHNPDWQETGEIGKIEPDGFIWLLNPTHAHTVEFKTISNRENGVSTIKRIEPNTPVKPA